jgi:NADH:ubiquinone oxidoreductase subunit 6 (subunit J)
VTVNGVAFWVLAAVAVVAALAVVGLPSLRLAAYALAGLGAATGLLFLVLGNELLFAAQLLVYGLALPAVFTLAISLTRGGRDADEGAGVLSNWWPVAVLLALGVGALLLGVVAVSGGSWVDTHTYPLSGQSVTRQMGELIFHTYALPFGVSAVLLLTALVGAIVTARRDDLEEELEAAEAARRHREERMRRRREDRERARRSQRPAAVGDAVGEVE